MKIKNFIIISFLFQFNFTQAALVDRSGNLLPEVKEIFKIFLNKDLIKKKIKISENPSITDYTRIGQEIFKRPDRLERSDPKSKEFYQNLIQLLSTQERAKLKNLFQALGDLDEVFPKSKKFDYILLNSSTVPNMRRRVQFLSEAIKNKNIELESQTKIVFLEGERNLFPSETREVLLSTSPFQQNPSWRAPTPLPRDERDAAVMVWEQLDLPQEMRSHPPIFIHAKKKTGTNRAETEDCVKDWIQKYNPRNGRALVVSSNPFVYYQLLVTQVLLKKFNVQGIELEAIGGAMKINEDSDENSLGLLLDNLARSLFYYTKYMNLSK